MGLESATYIDGLDASNPVVGDSVGAGDDHLRLIKSTVKATFPNLTGAMSCTQAELNVLDALASGKIILGNSSNAPAAVTPTGDVTISNAGVTAIGSGVIVNADVNASAAIDATKIHDGTVDNTEFGYLNGVTSAIQTQLNNRLVFPTTWNSMAASGNATAGQAYYNDTTNDYTLTLPASPSAGDQVWAVASSTGNIVLGRNGEEIVGKAGDYTISASNAAVIAIYSGVAAVGWVILNGAA